jgi:hypothetical protein
MTLLDRFDASSNIATRLREDRQSLVGGFDFLSFPLCPFLTVPEISQGVNSSA